MYYNFVRIHETLRTTPARAGGVTSRLWEIGDIVALLETWEEQSWLQKILGERAVERTAALMADRQCRRVAASASSNKSSARPRRMLARHRDNWDCRLSGVSRDDRRPDVSEPMAGQGCRRQQASETSRGFP